MSKKKGNYIGLVTRLGLETWLIYQGKINSIFYFFILKSYIPHFQLLISLATVISTLLLPLLFFLYQFGYNFISTQLFL